MRSHRYGKAVIVCDGCYAVIQDADPNDADGLHLHDLTSCLRLLRGRKPITDTRKEAPDAYVQLDREHGDSAGSTAAVDSAASAGSVVAECEASHGRVTRFA